MASFSEDIITTENVKHDENTIKLLSDKVEELYNFRDLYFESHSIASAAEKYKLVEQQLQSVLQIMLDYQDHIAVEHKAKFSYLKGRALNVMPNYNKEADELLSKAVKLDPKLVEAWNELGESHWKSDNLKEAENCFNAALSLGKNKVAFRNLSMIMRHKSSKTQDEKEKYVEEGLNLAREAVQMDSNDGLSWVILGNAYLCKFFSVVQLPITLRKCLCAYAQAVDDIRTKCNPDLYFNKAITLRYREHFKEALMSFEKAIQYEPAWEPPKMKAKQLIKYLENVTDFVNSSGKMKAKRLKQMIQSIDSKQLALYNAVGPTERIHEVALADLEMGNNQGKVVLGKVVCSVYNEDAVPFTFCVVDKSGTCAAVSLFNLAESRGVIIGDSVAIPEPYVTDVDFKWENEAFKFRLLRVEIPCSVAVNGKRLGRESLAGVQMSMFKKTV